MMTQQTRESRPSPVTLRAHSWQLRWWRTRHYLTQRMIVGVFLRLVFAADGIKGFRSVLSIPVGNIVQNTVRTQSKEPAEQPPIVRLSRGMHTNIVYWTSLLPWLIGRAGGSPIPSPLTRQICM